MTARCIQCNKRLHWRNQRGNKLANHKCECGGKYEAVGGHLAISGINPFEPEKTHTSEFKIGEFYYAEKNRKGEVFYSHSDGYYKHIKDFVLAQQTPPKPPTALDNFISIFEKKQNLLNEPGLPTSYCIGWNSWFPWNGKLDDTTYKIRLSRLLVIDRWDPEKQQELCDRLTECIIGLAKESGLAVKIHDARVRMCNPDRCVYESVLRCI